MQGHLLGNNEPRLQRLEVFESKYSGHVHGAAIRRPLNVSSQYSVVAERKHDLLGKWRKVF